jgi:hypothetical protein
MTKPRKFFSVEDRIVHFQYGTGTVVAIEPTYTVIDFDQNGRRKFVTTMVQLDPTDTLAPPPPTRKSRAKTPKPRK